MSFMISFLFMTFFITFTERIPIGVSTKASQVEPSTTILTTTGFRSKGMKVKISQLVIAKCSFEA